jgi:hypothetical protein
MPQRAKADNAVHLMRALSGPWAARFVTEALLPDLALHVGLADATPRSLRQRLSEPYSCLEALYGRYAFARRGGEQLEMGRLAVEAWHRTCSVDSCAFFLAQGHEDRVWACFCDACEAAGRKPMEQLNKGIVSGLARLAQEVYEGDAVGSIAQWFVEGVLSSGRVGPHFERLVDIPGVGPKLASMMLRDLTFLYDLEDQIDPSERIYLQPVDKWIRALAPHLLPDLEDASAPDWVLAGKISKQARRDGISGVRLNMGASYFGTREVRVPEAMSERLAKARAKSEPTG